MIEVIVFVTGAVIMALEILGTRVLNPSFGSGLYVWSALITVTLVSLAFGYYLGGLAADRWPRRGVLYGLLVLAAGLVLLVGVGAGPVLRATESLDLRIGSLVGAFTLFGLPLLCLGMVTPFAVRLRTREVERLGHVAGRLYALGTVGSVAGTLTTSFVLIPSVGCRTVLVLLAGILVLLGGVGFGLSRRLRAAAGILVLGGAAGAAFLLLKPDPAAVPGVVYDSEGILGRLTVVERTYDDGYIERFFLIDGACQTHLPRDPADGVDCEYIRTFELLTRWKPVARDVFLTGLAGGALVRLLKDYDLAFDVADIDPRSIRVAREQFGLDPSIPLEFFLEDGRRLLRRRSKTYDYIVIDMLTIDAVPFHLYSREAFEEARDHLKPGGILALNSSLHLDGDGELSSRSLYRTLKAVYPHVRCYNAHVDPANRIENRIFFASMTPLAGDPDPDPMAARRVYLNDAGARIYTDDANAFDVLLSSTSDVYRREFRRLFPEITLGGL